MAESTKTRFEPPSGCERPKFGPYSEHFPNLPVTTHDNRRALFYDDLLRGKTVLVNCMSTRDPASLNVVSKLAEVQARLDAGLGRDIFIYSLTTDPEFDTPGVLRTFAAGYKARDGWLFLTGERQTMAALRDAFFRGAAHKHGPGEDCSGSLIRYGNEAAGLWGTVAWMNEPEMIVDRVQWLRPRALPAGGPRRKGPPPL